MLRYLALKYWIPLVSFLFGSVCFLLIISGVYDQHTILRGLLGTGGALSFFTIVYYFMQASTSRSSLMSAVHKTTIEFLNEWRTDEFKQSRRHVIEKIQEKIRTDKNFIDKGFRGLDEDDKKHVTNISYFFDYLGNLCQVKALDNRLLFTMMSRPIVEYWEILRPLIHAERRKMKLHEVKETTFYHERYQGGFENLYMKAKNFKKIEAIKMLIDEDMDKTTSPPIANLSNFD